jgi:threonine dehydratase
MADVFIAFDQDQIRQCEKLIRPYVQRTPILAIDGADLGINSLKLSLKLELFQHSGSFKTRGAFANLLLRKAHAASCRGAGGAAAFAALTSGAYKPQGGERVVVIISGGNTTAVNFDQ